MFSVGGSSYGSGIQSQLGAHVEEGQTPKIWLLYPWGLWPLPMCVEVPPMLCSGAWWGDKGLDNLVDHYVLMTDVLLAPFPLNTSCNSYHMPRFVFPLVVKLNVLVDVIQLIWPSVWECVWNPRLFQQSQHLSLPFFIRDLVCSISWKYSPCVHL